MWNYGSATLIDCTVSGNSASEGGGVIQLRGTAMLTGCTVSGNTAKGGGGLDGTAPAGELNDTIVAGKSAPAGPATSAAWALKSPAGTA